jgi:hypothetical protein
MPLFTDLAYEKRYREKRISKKHGTIKKKRLRNRLYKITNYAPHSLLTMKPFTAIKGYTMHLLPITKSPSIFNNAKMISFKRT